jgi:putative ABC transport system permease protein
MRTIDVIGAAISNSFRSRLRTTLTVLAIFIGAFTLTITNGLGTGINAYIDDTVSALGASDVLTVTKTPENKTASGPQVYDETQITDASQAGPQASVVSAMTQADLDTIAAIDGVTSVEPRLTVKTDYVQHAGDTKYQLTVGGFVAGTTLQLAAGDQPSATSAELQIALPVSYVSLLGYSSDAEAVGSTVSIGITDTVGSRSVVQATVIGVSEAGLGAADNATANNALTQSLYDLQNAKKSDVAQKSYAQAVARFDTALSADEVTQLKDRFTTAGYEAQTVEDQIGTFKAVIDAIVLVLNAFAVIALLAASFGIVNTLLMSVQERTREIGLMKAMGMGGGRIFSLFSFEAVFIGFLGSALGAGIAMLVGTIVSTSLAGALFSSLPGLTLIAFNASSIVTIVLIVMGIAFLAGTLPAWRAARQDPIESLRYE